MATRISAIAFTIALAACGGGTGVMSTPPHNGPSASAAYSYHGVQIYPASDWFTTNLTIGGSTYVPNTVDPNSAQIVNYIASIYGDINWYTKPGQTVNLANKTTPMYAVNGCAFGCHDDPYNDDPYTPLQYPVTNPEFEEGTPGGIGCMGDCHDVTINALTGVDYEAYSFGSRNWDAAQSRFFTNNMAVYNLHHRYDEQRGYSCCTAAGLPLMGTTDWGEDASLPAINHIIAFEMPVFRQASGGHVAPAPSSPGACSSDCTYYLPFGARLLLHSGFVCPPPSTNPQANLLCNQLKTYGMILSDTEADGCTPNGSGPGYCIYGLRLGFSADETNPWHGDGCGCKPPEDLDALLLPASVYYMHITDFDVMSLGQISP